MRQEILREWEMNLRSIVFILTLLALLPGTAVAAAAVTCHYTYGGETRSVSAHATDTPYTVVPIKIGSYFLLRVVLEAGSAAKIYTYADHDDGPVAIHISEHPFPLARRRQAPGFTGFQTVYEPMRDGELQYWCAAGAATK